MLSASNRMRKSEEFTRVTKSGHRVTTPHLVLYHSVDREAAATPTVGLIINKSIGGSVQRHSIARQLRHSMRQFISDLHPHTHIVIRVIKSSDDYKSDLQTAMEKVMKVAK